MKTTLIGTCFLILACGFSTAYSAAFDNTDVTAAGNGDKNEQADLQIIPSQEEEGGLRDFFPPDPVPALGGAHLHGPGWQRLRLAGFSSAAKKLGISQEEQQAIHVQYRDCMKKARELEAKSKEDPQTLQPYKTWGAKREALGWEGYQQAKKMLSKPQIQRIEQVLLLKAGPRAFDRSPVQTFDPSHVQRNLALSEQQIAKITQARRDHDKRVGRNEQGGARPGGNTSYRQLGDDIRHLLNAKQLSKFNERRGIAQPENRAAIQEFVAAITPRLPKGWKITFNDQRVKLMREKTVWILPLFGMPARSSDETDEEYLRRNGYQSTLDIHVRFVSRLTEEEYRALAKQLAAGPPKPIKPLRGREVLDHGYQHADRHKLPKYLTDTHSLFEMTLPGSPEYTVKDDAAIEELKQVRKQLSLVVQPYDIRPKKSAAEEYNTPKKRHSAVPLPFWVTKNHP